MGLGGGFAAGFAQGQSIFKNINQQYQDGEQKRAMAEIADAKPETTSEFTADQGAEMEKLGGQGYKIDFDPAAKSYVAKNEAGDSKVFGMQQYTDLMGQRSTGAMSQAQVDNAKMLKMADVLAKNDPMSSLRMKKEVREGEYQSKRQARDEKAWAEEDAISSIDGQLGKSFDQSLVGQDGQKRAATVDDYLAQSQRRIAALNAGGHAKAAGEEFQKNLAWTHSKIQLDTKQREEAFGKAAYAAASGDYTPMQAAYNRFVPDGLQVTGVESGQDGSITLSRSRADGSAAEPKVFKSRDELLATMNTLNNPMSLYQYAGSEQQRALQLKQDKRADNADRRDQTKLNESIRHNRAMEGISANRGTGRNGQPSASFDPLSGFDEKQAQKIAADTVDKQFGEMGGSKLTAQEYAKKVSDTYFSLRDEYAKGTTGRQRSGAFLGEARKAKTDEEVESVRNAARERGFSDDEMAQLDPRFVVKKQATAPTTSSKSTAPPSQAPQVSRSPAATQSVDPVMDSAVGKQLDAAKQEVQAAQVELRAFGLRQRQQSPAGYEAAQQRLQAAKSAESQAQSQWQAQIDRGAMGAYFGSGKR